MLWWHKTPGEYASVARDYRRVIRAPLRALPQAEVKHQNSSVASYHRCRLKEPASPWWYETTGEYELVVLDYQRVIRARLRAHDQNTKAGQ